MSIKIQAKTNIATNDSSTDAGFVQKMIRYVGAAAKVMFNAAVVGTTALVAHAYIAPIVAGFVTPLALGPVLATGIVGLTYAACGLLALGVNHLVNLACASVRTAVSFSRDKLQGLVAARALKRAAGDAVPSMASVAAAA